MNTRPVILYVEDDADTFKLTELRLRSRYQLIWAQNDQEACAAVRTSGSTLHAVLMDIELQGSQLDGLQLAKVFHGLPVDHLPDFARDLRPVPTVPVVVLTAYIGRYDERDAAQAGASLFLTKPIDFARLNLALAQANIQAVMQQLSGRATV